MTRAWSASPSTSTRTRRPCARTSCRGKLGIGHAMNRERFICAVVVGSLAAGAAGEEPAVVAVLPFANRTGDAGLDRLGAGLRDLMAGDQAMSERFIVVERERFEELRGVQESEVAIGESEAARRAGQVLRAKRALFGFYELRG